MPHRHSNLPDGVAIGPDGEFVSVDQDAFDDIEMATFTAGVGIQAADLDGSTSFEGTLANFESVQIIDFDEFVDRSESLHLLSAEHRLTVYANSTETADGTVAAGVEVSASPSRSTVAGDVTVIDSPTIDDPIVGRASTDDTIDLIGRGLVAVGHAPFSDSSSGVGGGGSAGEDSVDIGALPAEAGQFHPRDELFVNGQVRTWNIDDAGVHVQVTGQHVYGVIED